MAYPPILEACIQKVSRPKSETLDDKFTGIFVL